MKRLLTALLFVLFAAQIPALRAQQLIDCSPGTACVNGGPHDTGTGDNLQAAAVKLNTNFLALPSEFFSPAPLTTAHGGTGASSLSAASIPTVSGSVTSGHCVQVLSSSPLLIEDSGAGCGSGGSSAFAALTGSTNTSAAMVVGTGASLGVAGTGTINANQVNGATVPTSATSLSTNSSGQIVSVTATGTGNDVRATSPTLVTPNIGAATASGLTLSASTGSTQCLHVNSSGVVAGTGSDCGTSGGGAVSSVTAGGSGSVSVSPNTGSVTVDLASQSTGTVLANLSGSSGPPTGTALTTLQAALVAANAQLVTATAPTGPTNDYNPSGFGATTAILYLTPTAGGSTLDGLVAGTAMQQVFLVNAEAAGGADQIILINQSGSDSTAGNRFMSSGNLAIPPGGGVQCLYLASSVSRWWCH